MDWTKQLSFKLRKNNMYEYNGPLTNRGLFIDRRKDLENAFLVCERIVNGGIGGVFVVGGRASGKTTFMEKLIEILNANGTPTVFIPLNRNMMKEENTLLFFKTMIDQAIIGLQSANLISKSVKDKLLNFVRGFSSLETGFEASGIRFLVKWEKEKKKEQFPYFVLKEAMEDLLKIIESEEGKKGIIFLFDEGNLFSMNRDLLEVLRNVFQFTPKLGVIIGGTLNLLNDVSQVFSPMARFFRKIELGPYPNAEDADEAINKPFEFAKNALAKEGVTVRGNFRYFSDYVIDVSRKMPMEINLLCHFAYDEASERFRKDGDIVELKFSLNKRVLESAMSELRGTIDYSDFIESLTDLEIEYLRILANSSYSLSSTELGVLVLCNKLGEALQELDMQRLCVDIGTEEDITVLSEANIGSIIEKGNKFEIETISKNVIGRQTHVLNDQWLASYFKIGWLQKSFDIDKGFTPIFGGIFMFQDPIASILHSIIFPRVSNHLRNATPFKVLSKKGTTAQFRKPYKTSRIYVLVNYLRTVDGLSYFYVLNLSKDAPCQEIKQDIIDIMSTLKSKRIVDNYNVTILH